MTTENVKALVSYRLGQATESLKASTTLLKEGILRSSINRSYYAMFYAILALLTVEKRETSKHSGAISLFDTEFVKKGLFARDFSRWLHDAFDLRQRADYAAEDPVSAEDAAIVLEHSRAFVQEIEMFLRKRTGAE